MDLDQLRTNIDEIDKEILKLLNKRYEYVHKVGQWKQNMSHEIYVPEREKKLLSRLEKINKGPLQTKALRAIYREIMSGALALEYPLSVAYPADARSFSKFATLGKFGQNVNTVSCKSIKNVFKEVEADRVNYGIVPIENSLKGVVTNTLDELIHSSVKICAEINVNSHYSLIANGSFDKIKSICAEASLFNACSNWLKDNLINTTKKSFSNTDKAYDAVQNSDGAALIANTSYSNHNNSLRIISNNIENNSNDITRFLILGKQSPQPTEDDKTSLFYLVNDRAGALCDALLPFKNRNIQITMLESRPSKKKNWEYYFFLDYLAHQTDKDFTEALKGLNKVCPSIKVLGSYPRSNDIL
ncbi:MAG: chorismate mutase [bacterium]|nr:chorismate mutase [bacterium]